MDALTVVTMISVVATPVLGVMTWLARAKVDGMQRAIDSLETELTNFRIKVAEDYVSRPTLGELLRPLMEELQKIDRKLDQKQDRPRS